MAKAKLAAVNGYYSVEIKEYDIPEPMEDGVLVKIEAAGVCGSDAHGLKNEHRTRACNFGHEFMGKVVAMGPKAAKAINCYNGTLAVGDRIAIYPHITCGHCEFCMEYGNGTCVVCTGSDSFCYGGGGETDRDPLLNYNPDIFPHFKGGYAEYVHLFPNTYVWKVPDDMPSKVATLLDPCAVAMRAVEQAMTSLGGTNEGISTGTTALVIGAGAIGILTGMILKTMGIKRLMISDMFDTKLAKAKAISKADDVINVSGLSSQERIDKVVAMTDGGCDLVINCANHSSSSVEGLQMVRKMGTYVEVGCAFDMGSNTSLADINVTRVFFAKNANITSVVANTPQCFNRAFNFLCRCGELPIADIITHPFYSLEDFIPTAKKMRDEDFLKAVMILNKDE